METYSNIEQSMSKSNLSKERENSTLAFTVSELYYDDIQKLIEKFSNTINISKPDHKYLNFYGDVKANVLIVIYRKDDEFFWWKIRTKSSSMVRNKTKKVNDEVKQVFKKTFVFKPKWDAFQFVLDGGKGEESLKEFIWSNLVYIKYNFENLLPEFGGMDIENSKNQKVNSLENNMETFEKNHTKISKEDKISKEEMLNIVEMAKKDVKINLDSDLPKVEKEDNAKVFESIKIVENKINNEHTVEYDELLSIINKLKTSVDKIYNSSLNSEHEIKMLKRKFSEFENNTVETKMENSSEGENFSNNFIRDEKINENKKIEKNDVDKKNIRDNDKDDDYLKFSTLGFK